MAAVETAIAAPAETTIPAVIVIPTAPAEAAIRMPVAPAVWKMRDGVETETADLPDLISRISHRWMTRHFPEEMTEDVRPADVSRIPEIWAKEKPSGCFDSLGAFLCLNRINWT